MQLKLKPLYQSINEFLNNPLVDTDSYKISHPWQYEEGMDGIVAYIEARGGAEFIQWQGMQINIREVFSRQITEEMVDFAEAFWTQHIGFFYRPGWDYVINECNGYIPVSIFSAEEGLLLPTKNSLALVLCQDPQFAKCVQHLETLMLRVWYPSSVGTISYTAKEMILAGMLESCDTLDKLPFMLHDFGSRGVSSPQSAAIGGCAHLVNFMGSDTGLGLIGARVWYGEEMAGYSIPASEHATITSWGLHTEGECAAYDNMIKAFGHTNIFACVSDGNDIEKACSELWGDRLREKVLAMNATLVIRPDSGDPIIWLPRLLDILADRFGYTTNTKGYKVLNKVRLIQGDGVTIETLPLMINAILKAGYSLDNVAFGMGGGLLQKVDRDTYKWAMKCSAIRINGVWKEVFKDPATDPGKKSKKGFPILCQKPDGSYTTFCGMPTKSQFAFADVLNQAKAMGLRPAMPAVYSHAKGITTPFIGSIEYGKVRANSVLKLKM